jgi:hypothetical protein
MPAGKEVDAKQDQTPIRENFVPKKKNPSHKPTK